MASTESRKNTREADFVWAFVTVQKREENGEWGVAYDVCTDVHCADFSRMRQWVACVA